MIYKFIKKERHIFLDIVNNLYSASVTISVFN